MLCKKGDLMIVRKGKLVERCYSDSSFRVTTSNKDYSFVQISDLFNFSSPAYFSRYVLHNLGVNPTIYRG